MREVGVNLIKIVYISPFSKSLSQKFWYTQKGHKPFDCRACHVPTEHIYKCFLRECEEFEPKHLVVLPILEEFNHHLHLSTEIQLSTSAKILLYGILSSTLLINELFNLITIIRNLNYVCIKYPILVYFLFIRLLLTFRISLIVHHSIHPSILGIYVRILQKWCEITFTDFFQKWIKVTQNRRIYIGSSNLHVSDKEVMSSSLPTQ